MANVFYNHAKFDSWEFKIFSKSRKKNKHYLKWQIKDQSEHPLNIIFIRSFLRSLNLQNIKTNKLIYRLKTLYIHILLVYDNIFDDLGELYMNPVRLKN